MLKEVDLAKINMDPFYTVGKEWMLISAGTEQKHNMMTASWGSFGVLWHKNVSSIYLRPQRYTLELIDENEFYALNFFDETYRSVLNYCGSHSGRDVDKEKETGLTPVFDREAPYYEQAKLVLICRKTYRQQFDSSGFYDSNVKDQNYAQNDYHQCYVGEIIASLSV